MAIFLLCCPLALCAVDRVDLEQPLNGALQDPWGVLLPTPPDPSAVPDDGAAPFPERLPQATSSSGSSFADFKAQHHSPLDLSNFGTLVEDTPAYNFDQAANDWKQFQPSPWPFATGSIVYGDAGSFFRHKATVAATTGTGSWRIAGWLVGTLGLLILLGIMLRHRASRGLH